MNKNLKDKNFVVENVYYPTSLFKYSWRLRFSIAMKVYLFYEVKKKSKKTNPLYESVINNL